MEPNLSGLSPNTSARILLPFPMRCLKTEYPVHGIEAVSTTHTTSAFTGFDAARLMPVRSSFSVIPSAALVISAIKFVTTLNWNIADGLAKLLLFVMGVIVQEINAPFLLNMTTMPSLPTVCTPSALSLPEQGSVCLRRSCMLSMLLLSL